MGFYMHGNPKKERGQKGVTLEPSSMLVLTSIFEFFGILQGPWVLKARERFLRMRLSQALGNSALWPQKVFLPQKFGV